VSGRTAQRRGILGGEERQFFRAIEFKKSRPSRGTIKLSIEIRLRGRPLSYGAPLISTSSRKPFQSRLSQKARHLLRECRASLDQSPWLASSRVHAMCQAPSRAEASKRLEHRSSPQSGVPNYGHRKFFPDGFFNLRATYRCSGEPLPPRHPWGAVAPLHTFLFAEAGVVPTADKLPSPSFCSAM
jgi:hypothetical protein